MGLIAIYYKFVNEKGINMKEPTQKIVPISFNETRPQEMKLLENINAFCKTNAISRSSVMKEALKAYFDNVEKTSKIATQ